MKITIINPAEDFPVYHGAQFLEQWGFRPVAMIGNAAITTVAALAPAHWNVNLIDEAVTPVEWDKVAPIVALTGTTVQTKRMRDLAGEARSRGHLVLIGGSYASLNPTEVEQWCDILCIGEMEDSAHQVFSDIEAGRWKSLYDGSKPDLSQTPVPRWDLYPNDRTLVGVVQTSRGCPFECDFCDVIAYLGRKQRHKPVENVLTELDQLYGLGYRSVFLADDNLTVYRRRAALLLNELKIWNSRRTEGPMSFGTQVSVDVARDAGLLSLLSEAGITDVFVGIETPNEESLLLARKRQNVGVDLIEVLEAFARNRIAASCGIIVGFDADGPDIFKRQTEFIAGLPVPFVSISPLSAPPQTPLHARLKAEGRIVEENAPTPLDPFSTNIIPLNMSRDELLRGVRELVLSVYEIDAFMVRVRHFIALWGGDLQPAELGQRQAGTLPPFARMILERLAQLGSREHRAMQEIVETLERRPWLVHQVIGFLMRYAQVRFLFAGAFATHCAELA